MRLKLEEGKQSELIYDLKENKNMTWNELSAFLDVSKSKLKGIAYEDNLISLDIFNRINNREYERFILEERNENWGMSKGGRRSEGNTKSIEIPSENKLPEVVGIIFGDGNIKSFKSDDGSTSYSVRIVGDSRYDYIEGYVKELFEEVFGLEGKIKREDDENTVRLKFHSKKLVDFLISKGLKKGDKIRNNITIPDWIKKNNDFLKRFIRGLFDTDGSVYELDNRNSKRIQFSLTNRNIDLLKDTREALLELDIFCSEISNIENKNGSARIYISSEEDLNKFCKEIGFHNPKHLNKIKEYYD